MAASPGRQPGSVQNQPPRFKIEDGGGSILKGRSVNSKKCQQEVAAMKRLSPDF
jgi:hypothetical protein